MYFLCCILEKFAEIIYYICILYLSLRVDECTEDIFGVPTWRKEINVNNPSTIEILGKAHDIIYVSSNIRACASFNGSASM